MDFGKSILVEYTDFAVEELQVVAQAIE